MKKNILKRAFLLLTGGVMVLSGAPIPTVYAADISLKNWKITLPICDGGEAKEIKQPDLDKYVAAGGSEWFKKTAEGLDFYVNSRGACTTGGSENPRSELREMNVDGSKEYNWNPSSGTHRMVVRQKVTELNVQGDSAGVVIGQIHDVDKEIDDYTVFRLEGKTLYAFVDGKKSKSKVIDNNFPLNQEISLGFSVEGNAIKFLYDRTGAAAQPPEVHSVPYPGGSKGAYFKAGNYCQCGKDGRSGSTRVVITGLGVTHDGSWPAIGGSSGGSGTVSSTCGPDDYDEEFYESNDVLFYNPCASATACKDPLGGSGSLIGADNYEKIWNYFIGKGLSSQSVAAILGNIRQESSGDPENTQTGYTPDRTKDPLQVSGSPQGGWGLIQWTPAEKVLDGAEKSGATGPIYELSTQLDILWGHMNGKPPITTGLFDVTKFQEAGSLAAAVDYFHDNIEGSADTTLVVREKYAEEFLKKFGGSTATDITDVTPAPEVSGGCDSEIGELGVGKGDFTDNGEVGGYNTVLANAQYADRTFNDAFYEKNVCAAITSVVWHGDLTPYGYNTAKELWDAKKDSVGHVDRSPKKGALLLYNSSQTAGHVNIYLGNNKILNDGKIVDANSPEEKWSMTYLGWIDPNDIGWKTEPIGNLTADEVKSWMGRYGLNI